MVNWLSSSIFPCLLIRLFVGPAMVTSFPSPPPSSPPLFPTLDAIVIHASLVSGGCVCVGGEGGFKKKLTKKLFLGKWSDMARKLSNYFVELFWPSPPPNIESGRGKWGVKENFWPQILFSRNGLK